MSQFHRIFFLIFPFSESSKIFKKKFVKLIYMISFHEFFLPGFFKNFEVSCLFTYFFVYNFFFKERAEIVGELLGIDPQMMMKAFCKPKIKVGTEWVTKGQNIDQSTQSVSGIARGIYDRVFKFLVEKCNQTLVDPTTTKSVFIGVLDIAGAYMYNT